MNEEDLFKQIAESLKTDSFNVKADTSYKEVAASSENTNGNLVEVKHPKNLFEIRETLEKIKVLREKREESKIYHMDDEEASLLSFLTSGIVLEEIPKHKEIMDSISMEYDLYLHKILQVHQNESLV